MAAPWMEDTFCESITNDSSFISRCPEIAADIQAGRLDLVTLVERLKDCLTDKQPAQRALGMTVLSQVLNELPVNFLPENSINFITSFYCDRLKDHHDVFPSVLIGILAICKMQNLSIEAPARMLSTMFMNITCQSQRQTDRYVIYQILHEIVTNRFEDVKSLGPDLVFNIIAAVDGERDPRNLMYLFSILPAIFKKLPLGHLTEDAFEVVACYFPVNFNPSAEDPGGITRDDLAKSLAFCLTAVPSFAEFCLPILQEKLDSALRLAKLDSLQLLEEACRSFPASELAAEINPLWMSISREALSGSDVQIRKAAQTALTALLSCLSTLPVGVERQSDPLRLLLGDVISATTSMLHEAHTNLFLPASQLLLAAAQSCSSACQTVLTKVVPLLISCFYEKEDVTQKLPLLQTINMFVSNSEEMGVNPQNINELQPQWETLLRLYLHSSKDLDSSIQKEAIRGLILLIPALNPQARLETYEILCSVIDVEKCDEVREKCEQALCKLAELCPEEVLDAVVSKRLTLDGFQENGTLKECIKHRLAARCSLATVEPFTSHVLPDIIKTITGSNFPELILASLSSLRKLLRSLHSTGNANVCEFLHKECNAVTVLVSWWFNTKNSMLDKNIASELLEETVLVVQSIMFCQNSSVQSNLLSDILPNFLVGVNSLQSLLPTSYPFCAQMVQLLEALVGSIRRDVSIPFFDDLLDQLLLVSLQCPESHSLSSCRLIGAIFNKTDPGPVLDKSLAKTVSVIESNLSSNEEKAHSSAVLLLSYVTKGLVLCGHKEMDNWINRVIALLGNEQQRVGEQAAEAFYIIMSESPIFLSSQSHCNVRLLYRQRFFQTAPLLVEGFRSAPVSTRKNYLLALAHLLQGVPQIVISSNLLQILPLILESLGQQQTLLLISALETLHSLLPEAIHMDKLSLEIQTIIKRLLPLCVYKESMKVRITAIQCLYDLCSFPVTLLLPFKEEVTNTLIACLDDPKRMVRKEAVRTRNKWIFLDSPRE